VYKILGMHLLVSVLHLGNLNVCANPKNSSCHKMHLALILIG
jgi:hypothetical protein